MVEATILLAASRQNGTSVIKDAATLYKVNTEAIGQKVKQEFATKAKAKKEPGEHSSQREPAVGNQGASREAGPVACPRIVKNRLSIAHRIRSVCFSFPNAKREWIEQTV
jgi:hypothetical protein